MSEAERFVGPYKGLIPYAGEDAPYFFGREADRELVIANLLGARLTVLYGPSGVGKSSLLRAGVEHRLRALAQENLDEQGAPEMAVAVFSAWQGDPVAGLLATVQDAVRDAWGGRRTIEPVPDRLTLAEGLAAWADRLGGLLLIVLDQFEEAFLYHAGDGDPRSLWNQLARAVREPNLHAGFLLSLREDTLAELDRFKGKIPALFSNTLRLDHLDRASARKAINGPLEEWNWRAGLTGEAAFRAEPELIEEVLDQVVVGKVSVGDVGHGVESRLAAHGTERIETPYLQLVLSRLWEEEARKGSHVLRRSTLIEKLGGAQEIVRTHLDDVLSALTDAERATAAHVLRNMVLPSGAKAALGVGDVAELAKLRAEQVEPVLYRLALPGVRILRPVTDNAGLIRYEIFHDVLAPAALDWRRRFEQNHAVEQERRKTRRLAAWLAAVVCLLLLTICFAIFAYTQRERAERQGHIAASRGLVAQGLLLPRDQLGLKLLLLAQAGRAPEQASEVNQVLFATLQAMPGIVSVQDDPDSSVFAYSSDGLWMAYSSGVNNLQIRSTVTHRSVGISLPENSLITSVSFSPDGRTLAAGIAHDGGSVQLWDVSTRKPLVRLLGESSGNVSRDAMRSVAFSSDGSKLVAMVGNSARIWDIVTQRQVGPVIQFEPTPSVRFSPGDQYLTAHRQMWSFGERRWVHDDFGITADTSKAFTRDGRLLAVGTVDGTVMIWSTREKRLLSPPFRLLSRPVRSMVFGDGNRILAAGDDSGATRLWSVTEHRPISDYYWGGGDTWALALNSGGTLLAKGGYDGTVELRQIGQESQRSFKGPHAQGHKEGVTRLRFTREDTELISVSRKGSRRIWSVGDLQKPPLYKAVLGHGLRSNLVALSPKGDLLASTDFTSQIHLWSVSRRTAVHLRHDPMVSSLSFSPDGQLLASGGMETIQLWSIAARKVVRRISGHKGAAVSALAFSPDGLFLASGGSDGTVRFWSMPEQSPVGAALYVGSGLRAMKFSPDRKILAAVNENGVRLWSVKDRLPLPELSGSLGTGEALAFSPDGLLMAASSREAIKVWALAESRQICTLDGDQIGVLGLAISPDDKTLASAGFNGTIQLWSTEECRPLGEGLKGPDGWATSVAFSQDGRVLASSHRVYRPAPDTPSIILWDIDPASWRDRACRIAGRNLSLEEWRQYQGNGVPYECTCPKLPPGEGIERCPNTR